MKSSLYILCNALSLIFVLVIQSDSLRISCVSPCDVVLREAMILYYYFTLFLTESMSLDYSIYTIEFVMRS